ncbi:MAG: DUF1641 domain-containing protein [Archaeoglobi archaeon]|nr:DUF1641 domain-containing protein [Archaeoglobi archaeon]
MSEDAVINTMVTLVERLSDDEEKMNALVEKLAEMVESGSAERLIELANTLAPLLETVSVFMDSETESVVNNLIEALGAVALSIDSNTIEIAEKMMDALNASRNAEPVTLMGLFRAMKDENVQKTLGFFVKFAREFGKRL